MNEKIKKFLFNYIYIPAISFFLACATYVSPEQKIMPDLDYSWIYALHYIFENGIEHGKDVIFPYGPLGFLFFQIPNDMYNVVQYVQLAVSFLFVGGAFLLFIKTQKENKYNVMLGFIFVFILGMLTPPVNRVFFVPLIFLLLREETKQKRYFFIACIFAALAFLSKIGFGLLGAFAIFSYSLYKLFENLKPADNKQIQITNDAKGMNIVVEVVTGALVYFATLAGTWFLLYGNITHLLEFILWSKEVSLGYAQTMVFFYEKHYLFLGLLILYYLFVPFFIKDKNLRIYHITTILMTLFFLKYAIVRHPNYISGYILSYIFVYICFMKKLTRINITYLIALFLAFGFLDSPTNTLKMYKNTFTKVFEPHGLEYIRDEMIKHKFNKFFTADITNARLQPVKLNPQTKNIIGTKTVDIFPWEQTFIYANDLNWKPRFMFHSYMENTEALDERTSLLFQSEDAPEFILWHKKLYDFDTEYERRGIMSIDRRYIFNEDPQTLYQIFNNYVPVNNDKISIIFKKTDTPQLPIKKEYPTKNIIVNEWTDVKDIPGNIMLLKIYPQRTFLGKIMNILGPDVFSYIDYKFYDGTISRFKFPLSTTAKHGFWVTPFIDNVNVPFDAKKVKQIRIAIDNPKTIEKTIPATWVAIPYKNSKLEFDFSKDNIISNLEKHKKSAKIYDTYYTSYIDYTGKNNKEKERKIKLLAPITLKKNKNYVLSLSFKSNMPEEHVYPRNYACKFIPGNKIQGTPKTYTITLLNNKTTQHANILYQTNNNIEFNEILIDCIRDTITFSDVKAKLYEF